MADECRSYTHTKEHIQCQTHNKAMYMFKHTKNMSIQQNTIKYSQCQPNVQILLQNIMYMQKTQTVIITIDSYRGRPPEMGLVVIC